eukprot:COSAG01_NODE_34_length_34978_cov_45.798475_9_plen_79_part_00
MCAAVTGRRLRWPAGNSTEAQGYSPEVRGFYPLGPRAALRHTIISASALGAISGQLAPLNWQRCSATLMVRAMKTSST